MLARAQVLGEGFKGLYSIMNYESSLHLSLPLCKIYSLAYNLFHLALCDFDTL